MRIIKNNQVRMANLGIYLSHAVNGVAQLHTNILKKDVLKVWNKISGDDKKDKELEEQFEKELQDEK